MRTIKFRGQVSDDHWLKGKIVTGSLIDYGNIAPTPTRYWITNTKHIFPVKPETIAQLVCYDVDNNEVYEGDILVDESGTEWKAILNHTITLPQYNGDEPFRGTWLKLKEAAT